MVCSLNDMQPPVFLEISSNSGFKKKEEEKAPVIIFFSSAVIKQFLYMLVMTNSEWAIYVFMQCMYPMQNKSWSCVVSRARRNPPTVLLGRA